VSIASLDRTADIVFAFDVWHKRSSTYTTRPMWFNGLPAPDLPGYYLPAATTSASPTAAPGG
jgi:hypothetical protein